MSTDNIKPTDQPSVDLAAEVAKVRADASEIAELCAIAGFPERSAAFIKDGTSISAVSRQLINAQAERSIGEVSSFIAPINSKAADGSIPDDALVAAIKAKHKL